MEYCHLHGECHKTSFMIDQHCSGNGLVPPGNKPLPEPILTPICCFIVLNLPDKETENILSSACNINYPYSKIHGANMGPTWILSAPDGPHVGPMNLAIRVQRFNSYFRQFGDEVMRIGLSRSLFNFLLRASDPSVGNVLSYRGCEQYGFLTHDADVATQPSDVQVLDVMAV